MARAGGYEGEPAGAAESRPGEPPSFLISAFFLYPRALALALPWNTRMRRSEDMFMGALWRSKGVTLLSEPRAQAVHDEQHHAREVGYIEFRTYANLFDALLANRNLPRALAIECLFLRRAQSSTSGIQRARGLTWPPGIVGIERWYAIGVICELWCANHYQKERREGEKPSPYKAYWEGC